MKLIKSLIFGITRLIQCVIRLAIWCGVAYGAFFIYVNVIQ